MVVNEALTDASTDGDPNGDGSLDPMEDEFVELVNVSNETLDLSGWTVIESDWSEWLPRHSFDVKLADVEKVDVGLHGQPPYAVVQKDNKWSLADPSVLPDGFRFDDAAARP